MPRIDRPRLADLPRTTAFRMTLLFGVLMITAVLLVLGFVYWRTGVFLTRRLDDTLVRETEEFLRTAVPEQSAHIDSLVDSDGRGYWKALLLAPDGHVLAGNLPALPPELTDADGKVHALPHGAGPAPEHHHKARGLAHRLPGGGVLVLALRTDEVHEVRELILRAMAAGLVGSVGLALAGGLALSFGTLRRIEAIHRASATIMAGDLSQRLPTRGSSDDFDKLAAIVNAMLGKIEGLIGDVKAAGDNIAHDLRTPLTRLRTRLEGALRRGGDVEAHRAAMEDAISDADQILATFRALLRIAEVEDGRRRAAFAPVDPVALATAAAELYEPLASAQGLAFAADVHPVGSVTGDADLLFEALGNLLDNAIKFTAIKYGGAGGAVSLTLRQEAGQAPEIVVRDTGPGITSAQRDMMFRRFTRGDDARHTPGNGLGLSLVAAVVQLHGFHLEVEDGQPGCVMRIRLGQGAG
ncbi:ATP-binding protein [Nitrospirillum sp. BR 11164]|uniref:ATP-binding protein n=1 Tax=Nitrospirillum sp. BR 11164 TaxID=3104324 RepID=UPI002AFE77CA|nr:ATP-binding protein [Nitrospirillum sp. BR 11164]MEA1648167.1 ATP-binding protein [Nitrospirillum sp. BR 11164]